jgi:copper chaperone CopZ
VILAFTNIDCDVSAATINTTLQGIDGVINVVWEFTSGESIGTADVDFCASQTNIAEMCTTVQTALSSMSPNLTCVPAGPP